jgi:DNA polymerase I
MSPKKNSPRQMSLDLFGDEPASPEVTGSNDSAGPATPATSDSSLPTRTENKLVILVDSHSLIYQVFHAMPTMTAPDGTEVGAVHGFFRDLIDLRDKFDPDYLLCCFDVGEATFRNDLYDQYKANREPMPPALHAQVERIRASMSTLGIPSIGLLGFEADDLLATLSTQAEAAGYRVMLVTSDKDCRQLLSDQTTMYNIRKATSFGPAELLEDWGVRPDQVIDFQSLVGDGVDNVPGVPKIGPKAARELLNQFNTLDILYSRLDEITGAARKLTLSENRDKAYLSQELVALRRDVPVDFEWTNWRNPPVDRADLTKLFQDLGFRRLAERYLEKYASAEQSAAPKSTLDRSRYRCIDTIAKLHELQSELLAYFQSCDQASRILSIDTETTSPSPAAADLVGIALAWPDAAPCYLPILGPDDERTRLLPIQSARDVLGPFLTDATIGKIGQNLKYDLTVFANHGFDVANVGFDTLIADYLCSPGDRNHSLDELAKRNLEHTMIPITDLIGTGKNQITMNAVAIDQITEYAAEDADVALQLMSMMQAKLASLDLQSVFQQLEMPLISVLADMERTGITIDLSQLQNLHDEFQKRCDRLFDQIIDVAGDGFNPDSPKQLAKLFFDDLKLRVVKKTKNGPSTDVEVLQELAEEHPLPKLIIDYRQMTKLKSTYVDALPKLVNPKTARVHTSFRQDVAATGRLSSSDPNLQNIPIRTDEGKRIRSAFIAGYPDWLLVSADYSQIELRMMAHYCDDATLKAAFMKNEDIHAAVASQVYAVPIDQVTSAQRRSAKAINFGILYGQSPFGLAKALGISKSDAATFIDEYFAKFSSVRSFILQTLTNARRDGYVATMSGRRRYLRGIRDFNKLNSNQQKTLLEPERMAVNTVIQGSAADLIKIAMIRVWHKLNASNLRAKMLLQIHDELLFESHRDDVDALKQLVQTEMTEAIQISVPLAVDVQVGANWADC